LISSKDFCFSSIKVINAIVSSVIGYAPFNSINASAMLL
jgi:hypothetical protein